MTTLHPVLPEATEATESLVTQYLTFSLSGEEYGLPIEYVREIKVWSALTRLPNTAPYIRGVMNLRGQIVPVFDLQVCFHQRPTEDHEKNVVIILNDGKQTIGLLADAVSDIVEALADDIRPVPVCEENTSQPFLSGLITHQQRMLVLLHAEQIFALTQAGITETTQAKLA